MFTNAISVTVIQTVVTVVFQQVLPAFLLLQVPLGNRIIVAQPGHFANEKGIYEAAYFPEASYSRRADLLSSSPYY